MRSAAGSESNPAAAPLSSCCISFVCCSAKSLMDGEGEVEAGAVEDLLRTGMSLPPAPSANSGELRIWLFGRAGKGGVSPLLAADAAAAAAAKKV